MTLAIRVLPAFPLALLMAGAAHAESRVSAVVSADGGYGSNPFFDQGSDAASATIRATPTISLIGPTTTLNLSGTVEQTFFSADYDDITNWSLGSSASVEISPRTSFSLGAGFSSAVATGINSVVAPTVPTLPDGSAPLPTPDPTLPDPTLPEVGGQRTKSYTGSASLVSQVTARDSLRFGANITKTDYPAGFNSDATSYGGSAGLMHAFSEKLSAGFSVSYSKTDYDQTAAGSFRQISPSIDATLKLAPRTTLNLSAGASFSKNEGLLVSTNQTYFSGSASLCHQGDRTDLCLSASRSVGATSFAGASTITSVGGNWNYRISPRGTVRLGASYSATKSTVLALNSFESRYASGSASYEHQLRERLSFTVNARYTDPLKSIGVRSKSFYGGVGVSYRLGR